MLDTLPPDMLAKVNPESLQQAKEKLREMVDAESK